MPILGTSGLYSDLERLYTVREVGIIDSITAEYAQEIALRAKEIIEEGGPESPAWKPLAQSTKETRLRKGYTPDDPLYMSGQLHDDITYTVYSEGVGAHADIGVEVGAQSAEYALAQEFGLPNDRPPARPYLRPAIMEFEPEFQAVSGRKVNKWASYFRNR